MIPPSTASGRLRAFFASAYAPLTAQALVLVGYLRFHLDDTDALLYRRMAANILATGDWFHIFWTRTQLADFHDHLPTPIWLVAVAQALVGPLGARLVYAAAVVATWWLIYRLAARFGHERAGRYALWMVPLTESYFGLQSVPRIDQPTLLLFAAALCLVGDGRPWRAALAGLCTGVVVTLRLPIGLALFGLVPVTGLVWHLHAGTRPRALRIAVALACYVVCAALPPVLLHLADRTWGEGDAWANYLSNQVFASISGTRVDGRPSHLAPLRAVASNFWPGLPLVLLTLGALFARPQLRRPFVAFLLLWAGGILAGLSMGQRHLPYHSWAAYPALFLLAGIGLQVLLDSIGERALARRLRTWAPVALVGTAALFTLLAPALLAAKACDTEASIARVDPASLCEKVAIVSETGEPLWWLAARVVDHLGRDVYFTSPAAVPAGEGCVQLIGTFSRIAPPREWKPVWSGRRFAFYTR